MFVKCLSAVLLCFFLISGSSQQVLVPAYSSAFVPSAFSYQPVYSPYVAAAAYPSVWAWGSNKNKDNTTAAPSSTLLNQNA